RAAARAGVRRDSVAEPEDSRVVRPVRRVRAARRARRAPHRKWPGERDPSFRRVLPYRRGAALERPGQHRHDEGGRRHLRVGAYGAACRARTALMKIGVLDSVIGGRDELDQFERARGIGCAGVEVILRRRQLRDPGTPAVLRAAKAATGLEIPAFVLDEHNLGGIASSEDGTAAAAADDVRVAIEWAAELGAGAILVPFFAQAELRDDAAVERVAAAFRDLCPLAAARGIVLAYEGTLPASRVRALAGRVGSPAFGCYVDLANPLVRGLDPPTAIPD